MTDAPSINRIHGECQACGRYLPGQPTQSGFYCFRHARRRGVPVPMCRPRGEPSGAATSSAAAGTPSETEA